MTTAVQRIGYWFLLTSLRAEQLSLLRAEARILRHYIVLFQVSHSKQPRIRVKTYVAT